MKNPFLYGALAVSLLTINSTATVQAQGAILPASEGSFDGKLRPEQGAKYQMRFFVRSKVVQDVPDAAQSKKFGFKKTESVSIVKFNADYDIVSVDAQGNHQVRVTYGDFSVDAEATVDGKSQPPKAKAATKRITNDYLKVMKGTTFLIKLSPSNKVFSVYGLDAMRKRLVNKIADFSPEARAGAEAMLSSFLSDKNAAKNFGNLSGELPTQPVRVSESWNYSTLAPEGFPVAPTIQGLRTLVSLKNGVATIKDTGTFTIKSPTPTKGSPLTAMDIEGKQTAISHITNETGMPLDTTATQTMNGVMTMQIAPKEKPIDLNLSAVNEFRLVMVKK